MEPRVAGKRLEFRHTFQHEWDGRVGFHAVDVIKIGTRGEIAKGAKTN